MRWQRIVIGLGKSRHCQTWLECRFSWNENLQWRKTWTSKSTILKENAGKVSQFFSSDQPSEPKSLDVALNIAGVGNKAWKTCECGQPGSHSIWVLNGKERLIVTVKICVLCGRWFSNQFEIVSKTPFSCDAVGRVSCRELYVARRCYVPWTGLEHSHRKTRLCAYLTLRSDVLIFRIPKHQSGCQELFATEKSWIY